MSMSLIVSYSRTGHTSSIAKQIAAGLEADVEPLQDLHQQSQLAGGLAALFRRGTPVKPLSHEAGRYDLVILGSPVWAGNLTPAMRTCISAHANEFARVAFFCTEGGFGGRHVFRQMEALCGKAPLATLEITEEDLKTGGHAEKTRAFVDTLTRKTGAAVAE